MKMDLECDWGSLAKTLLKEYNPLGFTQKDGNSMVFDCVASAYIFMLNTIQRNCPRGYIEMPLLLTKLYQHITYKEALKLTNSFMPMDIKVVIRLGDFGTIHAKRNLEKIGRALATITGIAFNEIAFNTAYDLLINRIELENGKSSK